MKGIAPISLAVVVMGTVAGCDPRALTYTGRPSTDAAASVAADTGRASADAAAGAGADTGAADAGIEAVLQIHPPHSCPPWQNGPIPAPDSTCETSPRACVWADGDPCFFPQLQATLAPTHAACHAYCGQYFIGFSAGCATTISFIHVGAIAPTTRDEAAACIAREVIGGQWTCGPPRELWVQIYIGSCTIP